MLDSVPEVAEVLAMDKMLSVDPVMPYARYPTPEGFGCVVKSADPQAVDPDLVVTVKGVATNDGALTSTTANEPLPLFVNMMFEDPRKVAPTP